MRRKCPKATECDQSIHRNARRSVVLRDAECATGLTGSTGSCGPSLQSGTPVSERKVKSLRILILGGTSFLGVHMTHLAQRRGHNVTLFNRGQSKQEFSPEVERLKGDRNGCLIALRGRAWDAVI